MFSISCLESTNSCQWSQFWQLGNLRRLESRNGILGCFSETTPSEPFIEVELSPGDRLILFTDGLVEVFTASTICLALKVWKIWSCNRQSYHSRICKRRCSRVWLRGGTVFLPTTCPWLSSKCAGAFRVVLPEWRQSTIRWHEVAVVHDTFTSSAVEIKSPCLPEASSSCKMFKCK